MIEYQKGTYLWNILFRSSGSALCRAMLPGLISTGIFLLIEYFWDPESKGELEHPYGVGVLVSSGSFLIIFRANYGYQRYWEATSATHHFLSKWLDAVIHAGIYHLQCKHYDSIKPPSFFDHPDLDRFQLTRDREKRSDYSSTTLKESKSLSATRRVVRSIEYVESDQKRKQALSEKNDMSTSFKAKSTRNFKLNGDAFDNEGMSTDEISINSRLLGNPRLDGGWGLLFPDDLRGPTATHYSHKDELHFFNNDGAPEGFASTKGGRTPSLFLQELAHLASLCAAVALSTLRNDVEGAESPLGIYEAGAPWPEADPDKCPKGQQKEFAPSFWKNIRYALLLDRGEEARTQYNTARPMLVIGGVSDNEIAFLQKAKGASAKTALAWNWLSEFIIREHLAGSLGKVGPPIVSRCFQFLSDGMIYYNHARKVMYVPFPFPHAQLSVFFIMALLPTVPLLMNQYTGERWLGAVLTFLTVTCLAGLHEVARELENPFRNVPNDLPLGTFLAFFNESLITMYSGYHPDLYWDPKKYDSLNNNLNMGKPIPILEENEENYKENDEVEPSSRIGKVKVSVPQSVGESPISSKMVDASLLHQMEAKMKLQTDEIERLKLIVENISSSGTKANGVR